MNLLFSNTMRGNILYILIFISFGFAGSILHQHDKHAEAKHEMMEKEEEEGGIPLQDRMDLAWQQEKEMTMDPKTGDVPRERLYSAWLYMKSRQQGFGKAAIPNVEWEERGPNNQGGRTRAILVDLSDPTGKTVWAGSVGGGLWKTTDITAASPSWTVINDFFQNLAITSIAQDPVNKSILYFGTGEGNGNSDAIRGMGIWKSTDGGANWSQLAATNNSTYTYCNKVFVSGADTVFVCNLNGLYRSVNGGGSFTKVLGSGIASAGGNVCYDIEMTSGGTLYATTSSGSAGTGTIHKSYNKGTTWTTPLTVTSVSKREIELAIADNDTNTIWGLVENSSTITAVIKSTNAGGSFAATTAYPADADGGISSTDFSRGQAWYDLSIAVDPNNSSVCYVGGVDLFKTANGGTSWTQVAHWTGSYGFPYVHADQHIALYSPGSSNIIYFGCDGGIFRSPNATSSTPTMESKGTNYNTAQFYGCAIHPTAGTIHFLAGAQDNGSHRFTTAGINPTVQVTGGDGALCHIDQNQPQYQFTSYVYNSYYTSTNSGASFSSGLSVANTGRFINPTDYDDVNNKLYAAHNSNTYLRWDNPQSGTTYTTVTVSLFNNTQSSAVKVSPTVRQRVYFGTSGGRILRVDSAHTSSPVVTYINNGSAMPSAYISCVEVDSLNENHILACYSNYGVTSIWETQNGGSSWTAIEGNLPDMPVRWILLNPSNSSQALIATELGVWSTDLINGTSTSWQPSNSGLANVRTDMLQTRGSDKMVIAATHGRGLFSSDVFMDPAVNFTANKQVAYINKAIQFTNASVKATSYFWDFGDGTNSSDKNPLKSYSTPGVYSITLSINSGGASLTRSGYITVLPYRGVPYTPSQGGDFETNASDFAPETVSGTAFERGTSAITAKSGTKSGSYAWVTGLTASAYADNSDARLYTPSFNFTAAGTYTLKFWAKNAFEISYDGYRVEYSVDGGDTWTPLGTTVVTNWYDYANTSTGRPFPQNQAFFNATKSAYAQLSYNVSALAGNNRVCFRFNFRADGSTTAAGLAIDDFEIAGPTNNPLPVSLLSFTGKRADKDNVQLSWSTGSEKNSKGFELQRKMNWTDAYETVAWVDSKGNSSSVQQYLRTDANASRFNSFYRLKQVDGDGSFSYSKEITVAGYAEPAEKLVSRIVPALNGQGFIIRSSAQEPITLQVMNSSGQLLQSIRVSHQQEVDMSGLAAGIYYFRFTSGSAVQTEKVFVR